MFKQEFIRKVFRFGSVGAVSATFQILLIWYFSSKIGWGERLSYWAAYFPALSLHFCLTKWWTFRSKRKDLWSQLGRYSVATVISAGFQYVIYRFSLKTFTPVPQYATMISTAAGMGLSFVLMKWGVFEMKSSPREFPVP